VNPSIKNLIHAVVSQVVEKGGYVTKTKLLKLLYLLDVEYYRVHRQTFTGFNWKFFHLGPWAREFDPLIEELVRTEALLESTSAKQDYDTKFFRAAEPRDTRGVFSTFADESLLLSILNTWSEASTGEILDYVYFRTEPMEHGVRNEPLDFSSVKQERPEKYVRPKSTISEKEIRKHRRNFQEKLSQQNAQASKFQFTAPRYDQEFEEALKKIEAADL
jgi:hypothetical protein